MHNIDPTFQERFQVFHKHFTESEVEDFIDGKIQLPSKSVVLTVDDGDDSFFELAIPLLQKYNVNATIRREFGSKIDAACGQLRSKKEEL